MSGARVGCSSVRVTVAGGVTDSPVDVVLLCVCFCEGLSPHPCTWIHAPALASLVPSLRKPAQLKLIDQGCVKE